MESIETECVIAGGGPAGVMLGYLLARSGIDVVVLEKWPDFFRDFRGDTIHPSTMQILKELGLLEKFLALPHNETREVSIHIGGGAQVVADFTHLTIGAPFIGFMPQWDFLNFIATEGKRYKGFHLLMETEATDIVLDDAQAKVVGVTATHAGKEHFIRAPLVVGADGRHSTIREKAGFVPKDEGAPIDVLWFRLSRKDDGAEESLGYAAAGRVLVLIDRDDYWQCAYLIKKGAFPAVKARGLEALQESIGTLVPGLRDAVRELTDWDQVKLLSVAVDHLPRWYAPGLVCIGDAAHAMSPVGGVGINLAVQDAVAAANILVPAYARPGGVTVSDLAALQARRSLPARLIQRGQVLIHARVLYPILTSMRPIALPRAFLFFDWFPYLRRVAARVIGVGFRPEHVHTEASDAAILI